MKHRSTYQQYHSLLETENIVKISEKFHWKGKIIETREITWIKHSKPSALTLCLLYSLATTPRVILQRHCLSQPQQTTFEWRKYLQTGYLVISRSSAVWLICNEHRYSLRSGFLFHLEIHKIQFQKNEEEHR